MPNQRQLSSPVFWGLCVTVSFGLGVSACGLARTSPPTPTLTSAPLATATPSPTATRTPIAVPTSTSSPCRARAIFGDPAKSLYVLPFPVGKSYRVIQSYCSGPQGSHVNQIAYDFGMSVGEDVTAARAGTVITYRDNSPPVLEGFDVPVNFSNAGGKLDMNGSLYQGKYYEALPY
jgi:hypothetical protein